MNYASIKSTDGGKAPHNMDAGKQPLCEAKALSAHRKAPARTGSSKPKQMK